MAWSAAAIHKICFISSGGQSVPTSPLELSSLQPPVLRNARTAKHSYVEHHNTNGNIEILSTPRLIELLKDTVVMISTVRLKLNNLFN